MKKAEEYRQHAKECRDLTRGLDAGPQRDQLLQMAETWERLAEERMQKTQQAAAGGQGEGAGRPDDEQSAA
jgi:hypothetical protein